MKKSLLAIASIAAVACLLNVFAVYCSEKKGVETTAVSGAQQSDDIITFGSPISQPLAGKLGQIKIITPSNGKLAHAFAILRKPGSNTSSYLALHDMTDTNNRESTLTYLINKLKITSLDENEDTTRLVYDPQISPNGRYVLFKYGQPWLNGLYRIYVLDIISRSLNLASKEYLRYKFVSWSPDSRYIAFAEGGDNEGNTIGWPDSYIGPINLYVCDWKTKKSSLVASNDTIRGPFRWLVPHELVYGLLSQRGQDILNKPSENDGGKTLIKPANNSNLASEKKLQKEPRPDIYIYSVESKKSKLIIKDGYLPTPSPDGEWIAFFGSESTDKPLPLRIGWERDPQGAALVVARIDGSGRVALNEQGGTYPPIVWLNDNSHFLTLNQVKESPNAQTDILMWDITTQRFSNVGSLQAKDFKEINRSIVEPQFLPLRLSADGKKLIVFVTEYVSKDPITKYLVTRGSLESVDLSRGAISLIFQTNDDFGIDWRD